jgi:hypothetical protein
MNDLVISQQLAALENQIEQERAARILAEQRKRAAIDEEYNQRVARYKQQIIDKALAERIKSKPVIHHEEDTKFNYNPGQDNSLEIKFRQLVDREDRPTADFEIEELRRKIDSL